MVTVGSRESGRTRVSENARMHTDCLGEPGQASSKSALVSGLVAVYLPFAGQADSVLRNEQHIVFLLPLAPGLGSRRNSRIARHLLSRLQVWRSEGYGAGPVVRRGNVLPLRRRNAARGFLKPAWSPLEFACLSCVFVVQK